MASLAYTSPDPYNNDPVFIRTHFLGRVASDGSGLEYQHELQKRRSSSRHSELDQWNASWFTPVTHTMSYDSDDASDTDDDAFVARTDQNKFDDEHHSRGRSSTLPNLVASTFHVEMARSRSMTAPVTSSTTEPRTLRKNRSTIGSTPKLMPARPLTIDTAQPLRLSTANVSSFSGSDAPLTLTVPSPIAAVGPSPKTCSPPVVRIECSESDGSCHGDAGDQDPEAQLAAGIIRLREQRKSSSTSTTKSPRRVGSKRRALTQSTRSAISQQPKSSDEADSDDAQSILIRKHGGNFVLRLAEMVLDFGSSALEKLIVSNSEAYLDRESIEAQQSPLQPRRRSSTTPKELSAEASELLRRRRERVGSVLPSDSASESEKGFKATLTRSWSVPKLLSLPLFNPSASLRALSSTTASTPVTPSATPVHLHPSFGFTSLSDEHPSFKEINSFEDVGATFSQQSASLYSSSTNATEVATESGHVSPLWRQ